MKLLDRKYIRDFFKGKRVCIVGSGPSILTQDGRHIDGFDEVIRISNYKLVPEKTGKRTDVYYSFFGGSIKKTPEDLKIDGIKFCMCKCPDAMAHKHDEMVDWDAKNTGGDFRAIYRRRADWWFTPVYIPTLEDYLDSFMLLGKHVPTTGFSCILELVECDVKELYITGFDFMTSKVHNVNEKWLGDYKNQDDPIKHVPDIELGIMRELADEFKFIKCDKTLEGLLK